MKKNLIILAVLSLQTSFFMAQKAEETTISNARRIIENAETSRINKDWSLIAEFKSGIGETVEFFPVQVVNLKTGGKENALEIDMALKMKGNAGFLGGLAGAATGNVAAAVSGMSTDGIVKAWVSYNEIDDFIAFIEQQILPNMETKYKNKSSEFIFNADEITLKFLIHEKRKRLSIILNSAPNYEFWTETRSDNIGDLLPILRRVKDKNLEF